MPHTANGFVRAGLEVRKHESGLPLGGIGAGKIEFCPDGRFTNVTTNNNWDAPIVDNQAKIPALPRIKEGFEGSVAENIARRQSIYSDEGIPGAWIGVHAPGLGAKVLKTVSRPAFTTMSPEAIQFNGRFPMAAVNYIGLAPLEVQLEAFSGFDLLDNSHGYLNSSLPFGLFALQVRNASELEVPATAAFSWQNLNGLGGYAGSPINEPDPTPPILRQDPVSSGLWFGHDPGSTSDLRVLGDFSLRVLSNDPDAAISHFVGWNPDGDGQELWEKFNQEGSLGGQNLKGRAGVLSATLTLQPGQEQTIIFCLAWNYPHLLAASNEVEHLVTYSAPAPDPRWNVADEARKDYGHIYNVWHEDSWSVAGFGLRNWANIRDRIATWQRSLSDSNVPDFFVEAACNDLFPLISNSWYTADEKFSINEAPTDMKGCMGTIDQRAVANAVAAMAFPGLDRSELELFAADQIMEEDPRRYGIHWNFISGRQDLRLDRVGAILHDVGWDHLEGGRTGRDGWLSSHWPDLSSVFVLQVYQHGIWNGDRAWLERMYPHVKAALRFQERLDQTGNGIADLWGSGCCTYDTELYPYYGSSSFIATLYLAALRAGERMAAAAGDLEFEGEARARFAMAQGVLENEIWHEELGYYRSWIDPNYEIWDGTLKAHEAESLNCHIGQLAGAWWAELLDLGEIVDRKRLRRALERIGSWNVDRVEGCPANEVDPEGGFAESWPLYALVYFSSLAIASGLPDAGWRGVEKTYRVRQQLDGSHWDTPLEYSGPNNEQPQWGRWYMSTPASWYLWLALSGVRLDRVDRKLSIRPSWPIEWGDELRAIPVYLPGLQMRVDCQRSDKSWSLQFEFVRIVGEALDLDEIWIQLPDHFRTDGTQISVDGITESGMSLEEDRTVRLQGPFQFSEAGEQFSVSAATE